MKKKSQVVIIVFLLISSFSGIAQDYEEEVVNKYFRTLSTASTNSGDWTKMASCQIVSSYQDFGTVFKLFANGGSNGTFFYGELIARFKRQATGAGNPTHYSLQSLDSNIGAENVKGIVNGSVIDIYIKINRSYTRYYFRRISRAGSLISGLNEQPFLSTVPTGDIVIECKEGSINAENLIVDNNVGIGSDNPSAWFAGKLLEIKDVRPILNLKSTDQLSTILFTNESIGSNHYGEFHMNHSFNSSNPSSSTLGISSYPSGKILILNSNGKVGIGTTNPDEKLTVNGTIHSTEVKVDLTVPGPDYVFESDYDLRSLAETEEYIKANKHLPEIPSAKEMEANGVELGEMNMLLLKKIEELTLHQIEMMKMIKRQQQEIETLKEN